MKTQTAEDRKAARARRANRVRESLENFDVLPDAAIIRVHTVAAVKGCSVPTVWRHLQLGLLPAPVRPSPKVTGWRVGDIRAHLKGLPPSVGTNPGTQHARDVLAAQRSAQAGAA